MANFISDAKAAFHEGHTVYHARRQGRSVAIRPAGDNFNVSLSDGHAIEEAADLSYSEAHDLVVLFLEVPSIPVGEEKGSVRMVINQGMRTAYVERWTPTRVRIEYEMPNAGWMGGWWHYATVCNQRLILGSRYCASRINKILNR